MPIAAVISCLFTRRNGSRWSCFNVWFVAEYRRKNPTTSNSETTTSRKTST